MKGGCELWWGQAARTSAGGGECGHRELRCGPPWRRLQGRARVGPSSKHACCDCAWDGCTAAGGRAQTGPTVDACGWRVHGEWQGTRVRHAVERVSGVSMCVACGGHASVAAVCACGCVGGCNYGLREVWAARANASAGGCK